MNLEDEPKNPDQTLQAEQPLEASPWISTSCSSGRPVDQGPRLSEVLLTLRTGEQTQHTNSVGGVQVVQALRADWLAVLLVFSWEGGADQ